MIKVGFLVNPVSGLGGSVGLKGTDGACVVRQALAQGAVPRAGTRALTALKALLAIRDQFILYTPSGHMGEDIAREAGLAPTLLPGVCARARGALTDTLPSDTVDAAGAMRNVGVSLLLFAGGDGTARDVMDAVGESIVVIGIPAGVKMHSGVFATDPRTAGLLARDCIEGRIRETERCEVMDIDEVAFRDGRVSACLYGYMTIPLNRGRTQGGKVSSPRDLHAAGGIGRAVAEGMLPGWLYIIGPGSTTAAVMDALHLPNTLLGVDLVMDGRLVAADAGEREIVARLEEDVKAKIIVTPIGGQACLFGRGNQQISPWVLRRVGKENILIVATQAKLGTFYGGRLLVDTGDEEIDRWLRGYYRVQVGYRQETVFPVGG